MTDHLDDLFAEYRAGLTPEIVPAGPGAVRATVRRRRRVAAVTVVATAIVLVAAPVAGYAAFSRGTSTVPEPGMSSTPAPSPSTAPSTTPPPVVTTPPPSPPNGRITRSDLLKARVDLPEWAPDAPCDESGADLVDVGDEDGDNLLTTVKYGDIDRDGAEETVAIIACVYLQTGQMQVVAFDRDEAGKIVTLGRVVATDRIVGQAKPDQIGWIASIDPRDDGTVRVVVGDDYPCCGWKEEWVQRQTRTYSWQGGTFRQTGGPTRYAPNPLFTDLVVSAPDLKLMINDDGDPYGTLVVTVENKGDLDAQILVQISFTQFRGYRLGPGWADCATVEPVPNELTGSFDCTLAEPVAAGTRRTLRFGFQGTEPPGDSLGTVSMSHRDGGEHVPDQTFDDNSADFEVS